MALFFLYGPTPGMAQPVQGYRHDESTSLYVPDKPTSLDPQFAMRLAAALVYAHKAGLLSKDEHAYVTSSFRDQRTQNDLLAQYEMNPRRFPHKPASESSHRGGFTADVGNIDPFSSPDLVANLVVALEQQGLYFPLLDDPVHVEIHPRSVSAQDAAIGYFALFGHEAPPRLTYTEQLQALQRTANSLRARFENAGRDITLGAQASSVVRKFSNDLEKALARTDASEDRATQLIAPIVGGMYALYRARQFPRAIPTADAQKLFRLYKDVGTDFATARLELSKVASLERQRDATAKLNGWALLRPVPTGESTSVRSSDSRWGEYVLAHPELWNRSASPENTLERAIQSERARTGPSGPESAPNSTSPDDSRGTIQVADPKTGRLGPVLDGGEGFTIQSKP